MKIYLHVIKFHFLRFLTYPLENLAIVAKFCIQLFFLIFFWSIVSKGSDSDISVIGLVSYFFIARGIADLTMGDRTDFGKTLRHHIQSGEISNYLIKPVNIIPYMYSLTIGKLGIRIILAVISIIAGIIFAGSIQMLSVLLFIIFFISAFFIAFSFNILEGALTFYLTEIDGIKNAINHVKEILSGAIIPLFFFPETLKSIIELTPFPYLVYWPAHSLEIVNLDNYILKSILISIFWAVISNIIVYILWKKALKKYEAIGI